MMRRILTQYFRSWWIPALVYIVLLVGFAITTDSQWEGLAVVADALLFMAGLAFLGLIASSIWSFIKNDGAWVSSICFSFSVVARRPLSLVSS